MATDPVLLASEAVLSTPAAILTAAAVNYCAAKGLPLDDELTNPEVQKVLIAANRGWRTYMAWLAGMLGNATYVTPPPDVVSALRGGGGEGAGKTGPMSPEMFLASLQAIASSPLKNQAMTVVQGMITGTPMSPAPASGAIANLPPVVPPKTSS